MLANWSFLFLSSFVQIYINFSFFAAFPTLLLLLIVNRCVFESVKIQATKMYMLFDCSQYKHCVVVDGVCVWEE